MEPGDDPERLECLPVLPSLNLPETKTFYQEKLGLSVLVFEDETYLILRGHGVELHFWLTDEREFCENSSVYIRGGSIDTLFELFSSRQLERLSDFTVRPWNMKEFYVHDPHGNLLRFGRIPTDGE